MPHLRNATNAAGAGAGDGTSGGAGTTSGGTSGGGGGGGGDDRATADDGSLKGASPCSHHNIYPHTTNATHSITIPYHIPPPHNNTPYQHIPS